MERKRYPTLIGLGTFLLAAGCAQTSLLVNSDTVDVVPVYRTSKPVGTAAGQYAVGRIDLTEGRVDAAIKRFRQALDLDPSYVEAHNGLGVAYGQQGRFVEAEAAFRAALALAPDTPHLLNNLGFARMKSGQLDDAWVALKRSLELESHNAQTRENLRQLAELRRTAAAQAGSATTATASATAAPATTATAVTSAAAPAAVAMTTPVAAPSIVAVPQPFAAWNPVATPAPVAAQAPEASPPRSVLVQVAPHLYELRYPEGQTAPSVSQAQAAQTDQARLATVEAPAARSEPKAGYRPASVAAVGLPPDPMPRPIDAPRRHSAQGGTPMTMALDGVEVSNGVGIRHLAGRTARKLAQLGVTVQRISDYQVFGRQRSEIHYRMGHLASAQAMQRSLPVDVRLVKSSRLHEGVNLRLVVGRDLVARRIAWLDDVEDTPATLAAGAVPVEPSPPLAAEQRAGKPTAVVDKVAGTSRFEGWRLL